MEEDKKQLNKNDPWWRPVMIFYAKTTSWIIFPLVISVILGNKLAPSSLLLFVALGFGITCFGIYKEIKQYKKDL